MIFLGLFLFRLLVSFRAPTAEAFSVSDRFSHLIHLFIRSFLIFFWPISQTVWTSLPEGLKLILPRKQGWNVDRISQDEVYDNLISGGL